MSNELLSVIIPVYNTEKWLQRCLDSVLGQSYSNMEVICVDDGATDQSGEILEAYAGRDSRIRILRHEKNRGLFCARVTGMRAAQGKYIAFVDSDDFLSCDWFAPLIKKAEDEDADMVLGNTVNIDEQGKKTYYSYYRRFNTGKEPLLAPELLARFFEQHGECFIWHTVWNKVYSRRMIQRALLYFKKMPEPLVMGEDIAFSSVFYAMSDKLAFCDNDCYFYFRHSEASTSLALPEEKLIKNLKDIVKVFSFIEEFLREIHEYEELERDYKLFKEKYYVIWSGNIHAAGLEQNDAVSRIFMSGFGKLPMNLPEAHEFYFYEKTCAWDERFETLKRAVLRSKCEYISFDVFDTLLLRPLWEPADLYKIEEEEFEAAFPGFAKLRSVSESGCRKQKKMAHRGSEDVSIDEIYAYMSERYGIDARQAEALKLRELRLEESLCFARRSGLELYELALRAGKKIICISDMYLGEEFVLRLLKKCGYEQIDKIFVSSKYGKLKATGRLYAEVCAKLNTFAANILHIGDNFEADMKRAAASGLQALHLPKAVDVFTNRISSIYTGDSFKDIYWGKSGLFDSRCVIKQLPLRCLYAVVADKMFDQPFRPFDKASTYNADPYYMGYMAMGMHLFGIAKWIYDVSLREGYETVHFFARDGYVVKQIFDRISAMMAQRAGKKIGSTYFCASRRALMPYAIRKSTDIYKLADMVDCTQQTPEDMLERIAPVCRELTEADVAEYVSRGFSFDEKFRSQAEFIRFLRAVSEISLDEEKAEAQFHLASAAFRKYFAGKCACFDIGYSGRLQTIISELADKPIDVFYVHNNGAKTEAIAEKYGFRTHCFYDFTPYNTGILRETLLSEPVASCIGYRFEGDSISFIYDDAEKIGYSEAFAIREIHRGALDFARDALCLLGEIILCATFRPQDISVALENLFLNATELDCSVFVNTDIEDKVYSGYERKSFYETLIWYRKTIPGVHVIYVSGEGAGAVSAKIKTRLGRALFYLLFDRKTFFTKVHAKLKRK